MNKKMVFLPLLLVVLIYGCTSTQINDVDFTNEMPTDLNIIHSTSLFEVEEVDKVDEFSPGYIITAMEDFLPEEFKVVKFKKTAYHQFDSSANGVYIHDSPGSGNYGRYDFLLIYHNLSLDYNVQDLISLPLTLVQQNGDYTEYSYDGYYSEMKNNHYYGRIVVFNHNSKKAFILVGSLGYVTSTEYKLKNYYNLP